MNETTLKVVKQTSKKKNVIFGWLMTSGKYEENQLACYYYRDNRRHENASQILKDSKGYVQSDGYKAYQRLEESNVNAGCWAHARRKVVKAVETKQDLIKKHNSLKNENDKQAFKEQYPSLQLVIKLYTLINKLYDIEYDCKEESIENIYKMRQEKSKPILDEIFVCANKIEQTYLPQAQSAKAAKYLINNQKHLKEYINDGRLEIDNNRAERTIKPCVIARKNFLFSYTESGARTSCIIFSILESALLNGLNPEQYLAYILDVMKEQGTSFSVLTSLLPCSKTLPNNLYTKKS